MREEFLLLKPEQLKKYKIRELFYTEVPIGSWAEHSRGIEDILELESYGNWGHEMWINLHWSSVYEQLSDYTGNIKGLASKLGVDSRVLLRVIRSRGVNYYRSSVKSVSSRISENNMFTHWGPAESYLLGYFLGDGTCTGRSLKWVVYNDKDKPNLENIFRSFNIEGREHSDGGLIFTITSPEVIERWKELGLFSKSKGEIKGIDFVNHGISLVHGFIDADGCLEKNHGYESLRMSSCDSNIIEGIASILNSSGIKYRLSKEISKNTNWRDRYKIVILRHEFQKMIDLGYLSPSGLTRKLPGLMLRSMEGKEINE